MNNLHKKLKQIVMALPVDEFFKFLPAVVYIFFIFILPIILGFLFNFFVGLAFGALVFLFRVWRALLFLKTITYKDKYLESFEKELFS